MKEICNGASSFDHIINNNTYRGANHSNNLRSNDIFTQTNNRDSFSPTTSTPTITYNGQGITNNNTPPRPTEEEIARRQVNATLMATSLNTGVGSDPVSDFAMGAITTTIAVLSIGTGGIGAIIIGGLSAMTWGIVSRANHNRNNH